LVYAYEKFFAQNVNRHALTKVNICAAKHFFRSLQEDDAAQEYVFRRISRETAFHFRLGYSGTSGSLIDALNVAGVAADTAALLGLINLDEEKKATEILFNRIVFPIFHAGMIVAFGGRTLGNSSAKYINTKNSPLYSKSEILYGLWNNREHVNSQRTLIMVEGYFDMLGLYDAGIKNVAALCGTSLNTRHIRYIRRYADRVCLLLDPDEAGRQAARKHISLLAKHSIECSSVGLPDGVDPDEYVAKYGSEKLLYKIEASW